MSKLKLTVILILAGIGFLSFNNEQDKPKIGLEYGDKTPNITANLTTGNEFNLESLQGKMVLIYFWASYDGTSRIDNHQLSQMQKKYSNSKFYNGDGFVILSVSLDRFKSLFNKAVKEDGFTNTLHICDLKGSESKIAEDYKVKTPTKFLIDGDGRLVAHSTSIKKIESSLSYLSSGNKKTPTTALRFN